MSNYIGKVLSSRPVIYQNLSYAGSASVPSTNFSKETFQIRVVSDIAGYLVIGDGTAVSATAQSSSMKIQTNVPAEVLYGHARPDGGFQFHVNFDGNDQHNGDGVAAAASILINPAHPMSAVWAIVLQKLNNELTTKFRGASVRTDIRRCHGS